MPVDVLEYPDPHAPVRPARRRASHRPSRPGLRSPRPSGQQPAWPDPDPDQARAHHWYVMQIGRPAGSDSRARRAVTPDGPVPVLVVVADGKISDLLPYETDPGCAGSRACRRTRCCCRAWWIRTCTSTSRAGPTGRGSRRRPAAAAAAASPRSSTCRSTACRRPQTPTALALKRAAAGGQCQVDVGFWGGAVPGNAAS